MGTGPADELVGQLFRGTDSKSGVGVLVVTRDPGGEHVWVENVDPPHAPRRILRRRLLSYAYERRGRLDVPIIDGQRRPDPPRYDGPAFASWLRRAMEMEGLTVADLAARSGIHPTMLNTLRRGIPTQQALDKGQTALHPSIESIAAVAHGMDLEFAYVASKAGFGGAGERFTASEARGLAELLGVEASDLEDVLREFAQPPRKEKV